MAYQLDGDVGFIGVDSRSNPSTLRPGYLQKSENMRLNLGRARVRGGLAIAAVSGTTFGSTLTSTVYNYNGNEYVVLGKADGVELFNTSTKALTSKTIVGAIAAGDDFVQANGALYVLRGAGANVLKWAGSTGNLEEVTGSVVTKTRARTGTTATVGTETPHHLRTGDTTTISGLPSAYNGTVTVTVIDYKKFSYTIASGEEAETVDAAGSVTVPAFPRASHAIFVQDRMVSVTGTDEISVSDYLAFDSPTDWNPISVFSVHRGGGGGIVRLFQWQKDKVLIFGRNAIHVAYLSTSDPASALGEDAYLHLITSQFGAVARRCVCAAGESVFFLSDSGIQMITPQLDLELVGVSEPLSAPIADVMERLSTSYASGACAAYWNNRLYFALPINETPVDIVSINARNASGTYYADVVTSSPHGLSTGNTMRVSGSGLAAFNLETTVTSVTSPTAFSYQITSMPTPTLDVSPNLSVQKVATRNNRVLVYSMLNKAWESVDRFDTPIFIDNLLLATRNGQQRLYAVSKEIGVMVYEELASDNRAQGTGLKLPFILPKKLISSDYTSSSILGTIRTRRYQFNSSHSKRFSSAEVTGECPEGGTVRVTARAVNPDSEKLVHTQTGPANGTEDFTARFRVASRGDSLEFDIDCYAMRPTIASIAVEAITQGRKLVSEE